METTHRVLHLVISSDRYDADLAEPRTLSVAAALAQLRRQPGIVEATFSAARSAADVVIDAARVSLGDVVRLLEDSGVSVNAVASGRPTPKLALVRA